MRESGDVGKWSGVGARRRLPGCASRLSTGGRRGGAHCWASSRRRLATSRRTHQAYGRIWHRTTE
ncbi:hypothetical protein, partial [Actinomyces oris]|uniref:hypothetical protein n=1 Tax=Actinomyces oris TaxID=544580 RepID=UPI00242A40A4